MIKCPLCGSQYNTLITKRNNISPYQNKLFDTTEAACRIQKVNLTMYICEKCGFVFNPTFDSSLELYDDNYNNDQNASKLFENYIDESIEYLIKRHINDYTRILEIGCGKNGTYLKKMMSKLNHSCSAIGYDPSYLKNERLLNNRLRFIKEYYDFNNEENEDVEFIISRHVIEHIKDPKMMISNIRRIMDRNINSKAFIETPDVSWILEKGAWFDFCYEHCSFFSPVSLEIALYENKLKITELITTFNNQYMQVIIENKKIYTEEFKYRVEKINKLSLNYIKNETKQISKYNELLHKLNNKGTTAIWGAGAKGNMFLNVLDSNKEYVSFVIDVNKSKNGKFISGTGHEIVMPNRIEELGINNILIMNDNYCDEIKKILRKEKIDINKINVISIEQL